MRMYQRRPRRNIIGSENESYLHLLTCVGCCRLSRLMNKESGRIQAADCRFLVRGLVHLSREPKTMRSESSTQVCEIRESGVTPRTRCAHSRRRNVDTVRHTLGSKRGWNQRIPLHSCGTPRHTSAPRSQSRWLRMPTRRLSVGTVRRMRYAVHWARRKTRRVPHNLARILDMTPSRASCCHCPLVLPLSMSAVIAPAASLLDLLTCACIASSTSATGFRNAEWPFEKVPRTDAVTAEPRVKTL